MNLEMNQLLSNMAGENRKFVRLGRHESKEKIEVGET